MKKIKILFFSEAVTLAHASRPMVLACSLNGDQYEIHFAWDDRYRALFCKDNDFQLITFHQINSIASELFLEALEKGNPVYDIQTLKAYVEDDLRLIKKIKPDIIIGDFRLSLCVSAELEKVTYVSLSNAYWSPYVEMRFQLVEHPLVDLLGYKLAQQLFSLVRPLVFAFHCRPLNKVRRMYGLKMIGYNLKRLYTYADHSLYADVPEMFPNHNLPSNHYFLGPIIWCPDLALPKWWTEVSGQKPVVYCTFGSSGAVDLLPDLISILVELDITIIVSTAGRLDLKIEHEDVFYADYLPGDKVVKRSNLVICNGGSPSTHQALMDGVPILGLVSNMDQRLNMDAIVDFGAGELLRVGESNKEKIRYVVERLLKDKSYERAAKNIQKNFYKYESKQRFVNYLEKIIENELPR